MAVFNVSFANKNTAGGGGSSQSYGILVDRLDILEASLSADGKLSPGDYDYLTSEAQKLYGHPGLTPSQRSNIEVKVAQYKSQSSKTKLKDVEDITRLKNEAEDDNRKASMLLGNTPDAFLKAQGAIQNAKVRQLADVINSLDAAGDDSSAHLLEYNEALASYQDTLEALEAVEQHQPGAAPNSDFVAYVTTNNDGEITSVKVAREGSNSGYLETNGLYGGLKIYGKLNRKENGKNVFVLGNQRFSGTDVVVPGADGTLKTSTLINESMQKGKPGIFTTAVAGYYEMDPAQVRTQQAIRSGGYAMGSKGFIYKKNDDGTYTKYVNATPEKLGVDESQLIRIPNSMEQSLLGSVNETIDAALPPAPIPVTPDLGIGNMTGMTTSTPATMTPTSTPTSSPMMSRLPAGSPPPQPTSSSPATQGNIFSRTVDSAKGFLGRIFGGQ